MSFNSPFTGNVVQPTDVSFRAFTIDANTQLAWPINGNATNNYAARIMEVTANSAGLELQMPPANQASVGQDALIRNVGLNTFTVTDFDGNGTIISVDPGQAKYIYIETNVDEYGTWGLINFGVGSSSADAATLAGYGLMAITTTLNQTHPVTTYSNPATLSSSQRAQACVWVGGAGTFTLESTSIVGNNWFTLVKNAGTGLLTVATTGGDLFDGSTTVSMQPGDSCFICCSGAAFYSVGLGKSTLFNFTQLTKNLTSGTYTLTSSEAANVILKFTGTLTGNVTVIVPQTVQVYYVSNQTNPGISGYTVTISTGVSGGATATIPASNQVTLICDSVNLLNANTVIAGGTSFSLIDGSAGAPAMSFGNENSTGIYRPASGQFGISILGVGVFDLSSTGLTINGTGTFLNGIEGGGY